MNNLSRLLSESWTQVRDLFPVRMDAARATMLGAIVNVIQNIEDPLGRDHRGFPVTSEHYVVGVALIEALRAFAGRDWSIDYDQAWRDAYQVIARKTLAGTDPPFGEG